MKELTRSRIISDIVLLTILLLCFYNFQRIWGWPTRRGFFCNDMSLKYPHRHETITSGALYVIGIFLPLIGMAMCDLLKDISSNRFVWAEFNQKLYLSWTYYLLGFAAERLLKDVAKYSIGRLRPHFMAVCQPQFNNGTTCADPHYNNIYIEDYVCAAKVSHQVCVNLHTSFPSGHCSLSFYSMIFLALYLHQQLKSKGVGLLLPGLELFCLGVAWFVALSRVFDYRHHWSDCLVGALLGSIIAIMVLWCYRHQELKQQRQQHFLTNTPIAE